MDGVASEAERPRPGAGYLLDNSAPQAGERFDGLGTLFNATTFRHLEALGVTEGWRCWEVGAGGPSIPRWLAARVGPSGRVVATDLDVRWLEGPVAELVEIRVHDVATDEAPPGPFDVVHERLVLVHVPRREVALKRMVDALRPGGWLLVEDFDSLLQPFACPDAVGTDQERANLMRAGFRTLLAGRGVDLQLGRKLPRLLREAGLVDVQADAYLPISIPAAASLEHANISQVREELIAGSLATAEEVDAHLAAVTAGALDIAMPPLVSAWGRKP